MKATKLFLLCSAILFSCSKSDNMDVLEFELLVPEAPVEKGDRRINIAPSQGESGFAATFESMLDVGTDLVEINLDWTYFEEQKGEYKDPDGLLQAVGYYADNNVDIAISLATINTVRRTDPMYLNNLSYHDPEYIQAFTDLIFWILETIPPHVNVDYISLGNEVDFVLQGKEWQDFKSFVEIASDRIHSKYPDIKCGVKMTITHGLLGANQDFVLDVIEISDVAMLNYYPSGADFKVHTIEQIKQDLGSVFSLVDKDIYMTELGFQSGEQYCDSSEEKQAIFYHEFFKIWDSNADKLKFVQINWMHDISSESLESFAQYYGSHDPGFLEFLSTLGLKYHNEEPKIAWEQILLEASTRGWKN